MYLLDEEGEREVKKSHPLRILTTGNNVRQEEHLAQAITQKAFQHFRDYHFACYSSPFSLVIFVASLKEIAIAS
jgi:hypothetical protein